MKKKTQIIALHIKGFSETAISRITGENFDEIRQFLIEHGKTPYEDAIKPWRDMNAEERKCIIKEYKLDLQATTVSIAKKYQTTQGTIYQYLKKNNVQLRKKSAMSPEVEDIIEETKKEPASAATDTSSEDVNEKSDDSTISIYKYNTLLAECQALTKALKYAHKGILSQYENMSNECQQAFDLGQLFAEIEQRMKEGGIEIDE